MPTTASFSDFINTNRAIAKKPGTDIASRWASRVISRGLDRQGHTGATLYLRDYGRGISIAKIMALALYAEFQNAATMALGFWAAAYERSTGTAPVMECAGVEQADAAVTSPVPKSTAQANIPGLPDHLQPGHIVTQQAVDAQHSREYYIMDTAYFGQPKRDGRKIVVIATPENVVYQSRSTSLLTTPDPAIDCSFCELARKRGPFILDGERVYLDAGGGEHRTTSQAAQANADLGKPAAPVICLLSIFKALYAHGKDLTGFTERERIDVAEKLVAALPHDVQVGTPALAAVEMVPTARTEVEKRALCAKQSNEGRVGEIWIQAGVRYIGGKSIVRTKYLTETDVVVTALTPTTVKGRLFDATVVSERTVTGLHHVG